MSTDLMAATVPSVLVKLHPLAEGPPRQFVIWPLLVCFKISRSRHLIAQELGNPSTYPSFQLSVRVLLGPLSLAALQQGGWKRGGEPASRGVRDCGQYISSGLSYHLSYFYFSCSSHLSFPPCGHFSSPAAISSALLPAAASTSGADPCS